MIFAKKKKILVWCDDPQEDPVISVFAGCLAKHDRAHSLMTNLRWTQLNSLQSGKVLGQKRFFPSFFFFPSHHRRQVLPSSRTTFRYNNSFLQHVECPVHSEDKSEPVQFLNSINNHSKRIPLLRWFVGINWKSSVSTKSIGSPRSRPNFFLSSFFFFSSRGEQRFERVWLHRHTMKGLLIFQQWM
jgi:hypothetical protein